MPELSCAPFADPRYRILVEHAPEAIVVFDVGSGQFVDCNQNAVRLFGRTREDLYDLDNLQRIATTNPWLTVVPVLESDPGVRGVEQGSLADVVTRYGAWEDRDVLVCGSPAMIRSTVSRMLVAGTPLDRIKYDPFTLD